MLIQVVLVARDATAATTSVSTTIEVDTTDPRWPRGLVETVTNQAQEGARRLRDELVGTGEGCAHAAGASADAPRPFEPPPFTPLAQVVPTAGAEASHRS